MYNRILKYNFHHPKFFAKKNLCAQVKLSVEDIEMLLNALVYDGKVERTVSGEGNNMYRAIQPLLSSPGLIKAPCGICPVRTFIAIYIIDTIWFYIFYLFFFSL